jgi:hypothetical protein
MNGFHELMGDWAPPPVQPQTRQDPSFHVRASPAAQAHCLLWPLHAQETLTSRRLTGNFADIASTLHFAAVKRPLQGAFEEEGCRVAEADMAHIIAVQVRSGRGQVRSGRGHCAVGGWVQIT